MACNNANVGPQKEMNLISEADIKIEDVKIELVDWPFEWMENLELNHQTMPQLQDYKPCSAQRNPMNEPLREIPVPTVELRLAYVVCSCQKNNLPFTRSKARKHKKMCYTVYN